MLLSQQAVLTRLDSQRAVVQVAGNWSAMVQSRLPLLEKAVASALGSPRQVVLEAGGTTPAITPPPPAPPTPAPAPAPAQRERPSAPQPHPTAAAPTAPPVEPIEAPISKSPEPSTPPGPRGLIDDQAKRLAEFFNGEVVDLQEPLPELSGEADAA